MAGYSSLARWPCGNHHHGWRHRQKVLGQKEGFGVDVQVCFACELYVLCPFCGEVIIWVESLHVNMMFPPLAALEAHKIFPASNFYGLLCTQHLADWPVKFSNSFSLFLVDK